jgi:hypothetical protein
MDGWMGGCIGTICTEGKQRRVNADLHDVKLLTFLVQNRNCFENVLQVPCTFYQLFHVSCFCE